MGEKFPRSRCWISDSGHVVNRISRRLLHVGDFPYCNVVIYKSAVQDAHPFPHHASVDILKVITEMAQWADLIYDVIIIGAGPSGLAAALATARAGRSVAVFDSQEYRNEGARAMHNVLLHDGQSPTLYRAAAIADIMSKYNSVIFFDDEVVSAEKTKILEQFDGFKIIGARGGQYKGKKLILATGSKDLRPDIPGYADLWGNGMWVLQIAGRKSFLLF